ncbi:J domain-containing protein [Natronosalvus halobius]|uniref:J domain-containing protein n=1 Tax=Natronosalvus halobius TaxID=2953746 RepID=UPI00209D8C99|nr:J domain-containing protein [Natronosalvus halobius]USZ72991.1 J domain-containing protein [Natronosalvus halobius]
MESHYEVLGVSPEADTDEIRRAYRTLLKRHHPDQGGSRARFLRIKRAYETITGEQDATALNGVRVEYYDPATQDITPPVGPAVDGSFLTLSLVGLVDDVALGRLLEHPVEVGTRVTAAFFTAHNTDDRPLAWRGRSNTSFVGDDGFLYQGSNVLRPHAANVPSRWCGTDAEIPPNLALDAVVVTQTVPDGVSIEKVVYTQPGPDGGSTERYLFDIRPRLRETLDRVPYERDREYHRE